MNVALISNHIPLSGLHGFVGDDHRNLSLQWSAGRRRRTTNRAATVGRGYFSAFC